MRKLISLVLSISLLFVAVAAPSCPFRKPNGDPIKPSELLTAARAFAIFPVAIGAASEAIEVIRADGDWKDEQARKANRILDEAQSKLDAALRVAESGVVDVESVRQLVSVALDLLEQGVRDGTFNVKNPTKQVYFSSLITAARAMVQAIYQVADALQPLPKEMEAAKPQQSITAGGVAAIVTIAAAATTEIIVIRNETNVKVLYQRAKDRSAAVHQVLASRK